MCLEIKVIKIKGYSSNVAVPPKNCEAFPPSILTCLCGRFFSQCVAFFHMTNLKGQDIQV